MEDTVPSLSLRTCRASTSVLGTVLHQARPRENPHARSYRCLSQNLWLREASAILYLPTLSQRLTLAKEDEQYYSRVSSQTFYMYTPMIFFY